MAVTRASWAQSFLSAAGFPTSNQNLKCIIGWEEAEGGAPELGGADTADYNPICTTQQESGSVNYETRQPGAGVQAYTSWGSGLRATVTTITNGLYAPIVNALKAGNTDSSTFADLVNSSQWGTHDLTASKIDGANLNDPGDFISPNNTLPGTTTASTPASTGTAPSLPSNAQATLPLASYDPLASVTQLTDAGAFSIVATQLNDSAQNGNVAAGAPRIEDLSEAIVDITIEDGAQGASILTMSVVDPGWTLLTRYGENPAFIDVDDAGLLIPVDVNYPASTDCWWRLCSAEMSIDVTQANVTLTFEDRIVSECRDLGGPKTAGSNQTRAQFIASCVGPVTDLRFVCPAAFAAAGSVAGDVTQGQISTSPGTSKLAKSATQSDAPSARQNPAKTSGTTRGTAKNGAVWTPGGWRYTKSINGQSPATLNALNPPTDQKDS